VQVIPIPTEVVSHSLLFPFQIPCFNPIPTVFPWDFHSHWETHSHTHLLSRRLVSVSAQKVACTSLVFTWSINAERHLTQIDQINRFIAVRHDEWSEGHGKNVFRLPSRLWRPRYLQQLKHTQKPQISDGWKTEIWLKFCFCKTKTIEIATKLFRFRMSVFWNILFSPQSSICSTVYNMALKDSAAKNVIFRSSKYIIQQFCQNLEIRRHSPF